MNDASEIRAKACENCHEEKSITEFLGRSREQIWCQECRDANPKGAKRARDKHYSALAATPEHNREHYQKRIAQWPDQHRRKDSDLMDIANVMIAEAIRDYQNYAYEYLKASGYTRGQAKKVVGFMEEAAQQIESVEQ